MKRGILLVISVAAFLLMWFVPSDQISSSAQSAQTKAYNEIYMPDGVIDNGLTLTGFFSRSHIKDPYWSVFIGGDGQVYKILLTGKKVSSLYIDGQKIDNDQIGKYTASFQTFLDKLWQNQAIENELRELELLMQPTNRRIEALEREMSKLDDAEEKLEKAGARKSAGYEQELRDINAQQKKLGEMINEREQEIDGLSSREEDLNDKKEALGIEKEADRVLRRITEDMRELGLTKGASNLSFKLSNVELVVNGKKPSPEVFEKLKAKYIFDVGTESGFLYNWKWKN